MRPIFFYGHWVIFAQSLACLNSIALTYIPVKNCGYIVVSFQVVVGNQIGAHIQYIGHGFIASLTHTAFGVLIYFKYLCFVILNVQLIVLCGRY